MKREKDHRFLADWGNLFTLRTKLSLLILSVSFSLVIIMIVLGLDAINKTSATAQSISRHALEDLSRHHMLKVTEENAGRNSLLLEKTMTEASLLADAAGQYFSEPGRFSMIGYLQGVADLQEMPGGHFVEGSKEKATVFIPNFVDIDNDVIQQLQVSRAFDHLAMSILDNDKKAAAVYYVSPLSYTRYYPKADLGLPSDFDATAEDFFTASLPSKNPERRKLWTPVYDDPAGNGLMVSAIAPVYTSDTQYSGIIGVDFRLGDLSQEIEVSSLSEGSYSFLIDKNARAIALPDSGYEEFFGRAREPDEYGADLSKLGGQLEHVIDAMTRGERGVERLTDTSEEKFIAFAPLGDAGWSLATVVSTDTILADVMLLQSALEKDTAEMAFGKLIPLAAVISLIVTSLAFYLAYRFTQPLRQLTNATAAIGRGEWDIELTHKSNDEVGVLSRTIADMAMQLKELVGDLESRVDERTSELSNALSVVEETNNQLHKEAADRQASDEARADMEARFTRAFQNAPIGMAILNLNGQVVSPNPQLQKIFWPEFNPLSAPALESVVVESERERFNSLSSALDDETLCDEFSCISHDGSIHRVVFFFSKVKNSKSNKDYIVLLAQDVTETRQMTELLEKQANHDELTGLKNRRAFSTSMNNVAKNDEGYTNAHLLFLDLDKFKIVNDTCGHAEGDRLLIAVSELLKSIVRSTDTVARLGGDEFAILLTDCNQEIAIRKAEEIRVAVQDFEFYSGVELFKIGVSIGLVSVDENNADLTELQQLADEACYAAKEAGRNCVQIVNNDKDSGNEKPVGMRWSQRLRDAVTNDKFVLFGQPIQSLSTNEGPVFVEVLLNMWDTDTQKLIPPGTFIPSAERYGLLVELDKWTVTHLVKTLTDLPKSVLEAHRFWVNLSSNSLEDSAFPDFLVETIENSNLPKGTINFEINEAVLMRSIGHAKPLLDGIRQLGCEVAVDDFGTGLSSLQSLKSLSVDYVKLNGAFIKGAESDEIDRLFIKSAVEISKHLGIKTIAKCVENNRTKSVVAMLSVDYGQGAFIHQPVELFSELLAKDLPRTG